MNPKRRNLFLKLCATGIGFTPLAYLASQTINKSKTSDQGSTDNPSSTNTSTTSSENSVMTTNFQDISITDPKTKRVIGVRIRLPEKKAPTGLIIYSPGLGSGYSNGAHWCDAWQRAGLVVVTLSHPVTNDIIWDTSKNGFKANLQAALASSQYSLRVNDCKFAISACLKDLGIETYIDPERIGIAGHSFGALTTQSITGQQGDKLKDVRIKAAIALSPGAIPIDRAKTMNQVHIPFMCVTGKQDNHVTFMYQNEAMKLGVPLANRLAIYEHLPKGNKYLLNLDAADHMSFSGEKMEATHFSRDVPASDEANTNTWKKVSHVTTAFWEYHLLDKTSKPKKSKDELKNLMKSVLEPKDVLELA